MIDTNQRATLRERVAARRANRPRSRVDVSPVGDLLIATSPEGKQAEASIADVFATQENGGFSVDLSTQKLPEGLVFARQRGRLAVWVHQTPPRIWNLRWIAADSQRDFGGAEYRNVAVSLPYVVLVAVFEAGMDGRPVIGHMNECFFRNAPLNAFDSDELLVPGLLNCSLYQSPHGKEKIARDDKPVVWICTQYMHQLMSRRARAMQSGATEGTLMHGHFDVLYRTLMETGFNYSSDHHEHSSGFTENANVILQAASTLVECKLDGRDKRGAAMEAWQAATQKDADFGLAVPWLTTGYTVAEVVERILSRGETNATAVRTVEDLSRIVFALAAKKARAKA